VTQPPALLFWVLTSMPLVLAVYATLRSLIPNAPGGVVMIIAHALALSATYPFLYVRYVRERCKERFYELTGLRRRPRGGKAS
jgi:hypothetical protein